MIYRRALLALAAGTLMSGAALAQSTQTEITVLRGIGRDAAAPTGVTVIRGEPGTQPQARPAPQIARGRTVAAGEDFWLYDPENSRLTACDFTRGTNVGSRRIRCFTRHLSR